MTTDKTTIDSLRDAGYSDEALSLVTATEPAATARKAGAEWPPITREIKKVIAPFGSAAGIALKAVGQKAADTLIAEGWDFEAAFPFQLSQHPEVSQAFRDALGRDPHAGEGPALQQIIRLHLEHEKDAAETIASTTGRLTVP